MLPQPWSENKLDLVLCGFFGKAFNRQPGPLKQLNRKQASLSKQWLNIVTFEKAVQETAVF